MNENFLSYLWMFGLVGQQLTTTEGDVLEVIHPGVLNRDAGPDFFNARIRIGGTLWAGNVEIHVKSSDFNMHGHHQDLRYQNIILHVVYEDDAPVCYKNGELIPTLCLMGKFQEELLKHYNSFMDNKLWVPCANLVRNVSPETVKRWLDKLLVIRLNNKAAQIERSLVFNNFNWENTFYQHLSASFGFNVNSHAFELLSKTLPLDIIIRHNTITETEALLFGQAGMLNQAFKDDYPLELQKIYLQFRKRYALQQIDGHLWNFLRLRPSNFPTIRLSQFANLLCTTPALFQKVIQIKDIKKLQDIFNVSTSDYWESHYVFDRPSVMKNKNLGRSAINLLLINNVAPFLFVFGQLNTKTVYIDRAILFLSSLPGEKNRITDKWISSGISVSSAYESQALLSLTRNYCNKKKCLQCEIGNDVLKKVVS